MPRDFYFEEGLILTVVAALILGFMQALTNNTNTKTSASMSVSTTANSRERSVLLYKLALLRITVVAAISTSIPQIKPLIKC